MGSPKAGPYTLDRTSRTVDNRIQHHRSSIPGLDLALRIELREFHQGATVFRPATPSQYRSYSDLLSPHLVRHLRSLSSVLSLIHRIEPEPDKNVQRPGSSVDDIVRHVGSCTPPAAIGVVWQIEEFAELLVVGFSSAFRDYNSSPSEAARAARSSIRNA
jgi:hypothetical protein